MSEWIVVLKNSAEIFTPTPAPRLRGGDSQIMSVESFAAGSSIANGDVPVEQIFRYYAACVLAGRTALRILSPD